MIELYIFQPTTYERLQYSSEVSVLIFKSHGEQNKYNC